VIDVRLAHATFDPAAELARFASEHGESGAIVSFLGQVRGEGVEALELTHYEPLTLPGMAALAEAARTRFALDGLLAIHRVGTLPAGDPIVLAAAAARHRRQAFQSVDFTMDYLKSQSWFWKREQRAGAWRWVEPRVDDIRDLARWR
jgi:molybdopterin synthase catalytic subunit